MCLNWLPEQGKRWLIPEYSQRLLYSRGDFTEKKESTQMYYWWAGKA